MKLVIGNKNYSSWSLRPWLAMRHLDIPFEEVLIPLDELETKTMILTHSPGGKVPILKDGDVTVSESLAILEYLAEAFPEKSLCLSPPSARAVARAPSCVIHVGFLSTRSSSPLYLRQRLS